MNNKNKMKKQNIQPLEIERWYKVKEEDDEDCRASVKKCCCCIGLVAILIAGFIASIVILVTLVLKPKKPTFSLKGVKIDYMNMQMLKSYIVLTMNMTLSFRATNPNPKFGIEYDGGIFHLLYKEMPIGFAEAPTFYQPPSSRDVHVDILLVVRNGVFPMELALHLMADTLTSDDKKHLSMRVAGDIGTRIRVMNNVTMPLVTLELDCMIAGNPSGHVTRFSTAYSPLGIKLSSSVSFKPRCSVLVDL